MKRKILAVALSALVAASMCALPTLAAAMSPTATPYLKVIDISSHDMTDTETASDIDFAAAAKDVDAIYIKATEGHSYTFNAYSSCAQACIDNHINFGFYDYFWPYDNDDEAVQAADYFYDAISQFQGKYELTPVIDCEESSNDQENITPDAIRHSLQVFIQEFESRGGETPMIYASPDFVNTNFDSSFSTYKFWIANYGVSSPVDTNVWHTWDCWQYTGAGDGSQNGISVSGFPKNTDGDLATANIFINPADAPAQSVTGSKPATSSAASSSSASSSGEAASSAPASSSEAAVSSQPASSSEIASSSQIASSSEVSSASAPSSSAVSSAASSKASSSSKAASSAVSSEDSSSWGNGGLFGSSSSAAASSGTSSAVSSENNVNTGDSGVPIAAAVALSLLSAAAIVCYRKKK